MTQEQVQPVAQPVQTIPPPHDLRSPLNSSVTGQHLLLGELVLPFTEDEGDPSGDMSATDGLAKLWLNNDLLSLSIFSRTLGRWTTFVEEAIGTVKIYVGLEANIPAGWFIANGENGTHDWRGYFLQVGELADSGTTTEAVAAVIADHSGHSNHAVTQPNTHTGADMESADGWPNGTIEVQAGSGEFAAAYNHDHDWNNLPAHAGTAVDAHSAHSSHTMTSDYVPPSVIIALIEKVAYA